MSASSPVLFIALPQCRPATLCPDGLPIFDLESIAGPACLPLMSMLGPTLLL